MDLRYSLISTLNDMYVYCAANRSVFFFFSTGRPFCFSKKAWILTKPVIFIICIIYHRRFNLQCWSFNNLFKTLGCIPSNIIRTNQSSQRHNMDTHTHLTLSLRVPTFDKSHSKFTLNPIFNDLKK